MKLKAVVENLDDVPEQFHELYTERNGQYELTGVEGMRTTADVERVKTALQKEREEHKETRNKFKPLSSFGDEELEDIANNYEEYKTIAESGGKVDDDKINTLVETRIKSKLGPLERERETLKEQLSERDQRLQTFEQREKARKVRKSIREAATKQKVRPEALEDILVIGEMRFELDENENVIAKEDSGVLAGISPDAWLTEMQDKRPHWWGDSVGGNAIGNRGGKVSNNPWSAEHWNMTEQGRILRENPSKAEQLAKVAGTTIGGQKPKKK